MGIFPAELAPKKPQTKKELPLTKIKKISAGDLTEKIENAQYYRVPCTTMTVAFLTLDNGMTVTGESDCLNPEDFDADIGNKIAYDNAFAKLWALEGYHRLQMQHVVTAFALSPAALPAMPAVAVPPHDDLIAFIGAKIVNAKPMSRAIYAQLRGWDLPANEDGNDAGYLVEYTDAQRPNVPGFQGYVSWSPKDVFETAYHEIVANSATASEDLGDGVKLVGGDHEVPPAFGG